MICGGVVIALVGITTGSWKRTRIAQAREESRREIAAYVAEGSMTAEDGAKLLDTDKNFMKKITGC